MDCSALRYLQLQIYSPTINRNINPLTCDEPNNTTEILSEILHLSEFENLNFRTYSHLQNNL
ncbi:unnamed protein product [Bemisia tabaci]|uniref:Uncharacterized protein n=1 Tax=Bemisia tabaci TaxID=7038 RepID=A0A9P0F7U0_BEMTA|nr:unnamed protein product [Bemisia tabaci]